jgi:hypothetical protein
VRSRSNKGVLPHAVHVKRIAERQEETFHKLCSNISLILLVVYTHYCKNAIAHEDRIDFQINPKNKNA